MLCKSVLITGCNRGLGYEIVKQLMNSPHPPRHIIATCRSPESSKSLLERGRSNNDVLKILNLDVTDESQYKSFVDEVGDIVGVDGLNLLINNAGIAVKQSGIDAVTRTQMRETLEVNTIAPLFLIQDLLPLLKRAASKIAGNGMNAGRAAIINVSSLLGSIHDNDSGGLYPYRASKCALNAISKSLSVDLKPHNILVTSIHPGWVQTDMGGLKAPLTPQDSVSNIINTLHSLNEEHNGAFLQYDRKKLLW